MSNLNNLRGMGIDMKQSSIKEQLAKVSGQKIKRDVIEYNEALVLVKQKLSEQQIVYRPLNEDGTEVVIKNKQYLKNKIEYMTGEIRKIVLNESWSVKGYEGDKNLLSMGIEKTDTEEFYYKNEYVPNCPPELKNEEDMAIERLKENDDLCIPWNTISTKKKNIDTLIYELTADISGLRALTPVYFDPAVSDIFVIKWNQIYAERKGINRLYKGTFRNRKDYAEFMEHYLAECGKTVDKGKNKIVDFEVYGNRGCAVNSTITPKDTSLTLRIHPENHINLTQIKKAGVFNDEMEEFFRLILKGECNLIYAGLTGSGKTTTIRALLDAFIPKLKKRAMVCEDTQELFLENPHTLEFVSFKHQEKDLAVSLQQLIYTALRQKPKYIIVGEVRAEEAQAAVEGMETGHSTIFTMHGGRPMNCINRLVTKYLVAMPSLGIEVVERIIGEAVDYIAIQDNVPGIGRRITNISEIYYDYEKRTVGIKPIFKFDFKKNEFVRLGSLGEDKISKMLARGVTYDELENGRFENWIEQVS